MRATASLVSMLFLVFPLIANGVEDSFSMRLDRPGGSMEFIPVKNQGFLNTCAAHVAADMIDAWRFSHSEQVDKTDYTSVIEIAIGHKYQNTHTSEWGRIQERFMEVTLGNSLRPFEWSFVDGLVEYVRKYGRCSSAQFLQNAEDGPTLGEQVDSIAAAWNTANEHRNSKKSWWPTWEVLSDEDYYYSIADGLHKKLISTQMEAPPSVPELIDILGTSPTSIEAFYRIYFGSCKEREMLPNLPKMQKDVPRSVEEFGAILSRHFDHPETPIQPIAVDYCSQLLTAGSSYHGIIAGHLPAPGCGLHASLIVGRRVNHGKIEVLIQNSIGKNTYYHSDFETDLEVEELEVTVYEKDGSCHYVKNASQKKDLIEKYRAEGATILELSRHSSGKIWVPVDVLLKNTFHLYTWQ